MAELSGLVVDQIKLPPGFRFHPTDEELITHYLSAKVLDCSFIAEAIGQVDLNKVEPWDLPWKAKMGEKEWYFFCLRDRKYPTGLRTNRATDAGHWKATGKDKDIFRAKILIGMKKTLVFYGGRAPRGEKTDWVMHEYRLEGNNSLCNLPITAQNEWVVCRIFKKSSGGEKLRVSGPVSMTNYGPDSKSSDLSPLVEMTSDENHTKRFIGTELSHSTCFSSPMEGNLLPELSSSPLRNSDFSTPDSNFTSQSLIKPRVHNHHHPDSQDQSELIRNIADSGFCHDTGMNTGIYSVYCGHSEDGIKAFEGGDFEPSWTCPVDLCDF